MADYPTFAIAKRPSSADKTRYEAMGLIVSDTVTLLVEASDLTITPQPGDIVTWADVVYTVRDVDVLAPDGTPILFTVVASV